VGRATGGKNYQQFKAAIARLQGTRIETTIRRRDKERMEVFKG
jgi:plasmid replication initiation protein